MMRRALMCGYRSKAFGRAREHEYDARVFLSMTANVRADTVVLNSNGGSLYAGVTIGKAIRRFGIATMSHPKLALACCHVLSPG